MQSLPDDRTARARIRDEALRRFGEAGPDAVAIRDVAAAAGVSPALVVRHYGSKDGLRAAVDEYVTSVFSALLGEVVDSFGQRALPSLAELVAAKLPADSAVPAYLGRMLLDGRAGSELFERLHRVSRDTLDGMVAAGTASEGTDPDVRAAFLLVNDLAVLMLRERLRETLGVDPLAAEGMRRWGAEVLSIYRGGLGATPAGTDRGDPAEPGESR